LVEDGNIHLTLKFLGDVDETQLERVKTVVSSMDLNPFNLSMKGIGVFPNLRRPRTVWVAVTGGVSEITEIYRRLEDVLERLGFQREKRSFSPHVTIARVRDGRNRDQLAEGIHEMRDLTFGSFKVERIVLKKSVLTPRGPIYSNIASSKANF
jgi:2'-5' RNA ligase